MTAAPAPEPGRPVVLVTGASGGIGTATALAYAGRGAHLVLVSRSRHRLEALARRCRSRGGSAEVVVADVTDAGAVEAAVTGVVRREGRLDVCVHAAASLAYGRLDEVPPQVWDRVLDVGVRGTSVVARAALRRFRTQGRGTLVVVGSVLGDVTTPWMGSYVMTKWAQHGLVRVLRQELRDLPDVHVCLVTPGSVDTAIYRLAGSYVGRTGRPPYPVLSATRAAVAVLRAADGGRARTNVGPANRLMRLGFALTPAVYDVLVGPLMRRFGLGEPVEPHPGNVLVASEESPGSARRAPGS